MADEHGQITTARPPDLWKRWRGPILVMLSTAGCLLFLTAAIGIGLGIYYSREAEIKQAFEGTTTDDVVIYIVSWLVLLAISYMAILAIREMLNERAEDALRRRAHYIAIMIGLVLTIFLFRQPFLDELFGGKSTEYWLKVLLFGGGAAGGWIVWYLRQLRYYGEFFNVFLMTTVTGFCWYARLTAPEDVQLTAVAFLLGSLFRIAKDNLDQAAQQDKVQQNKAKL